jgi:hypothetical protein
MTVTCSSNHDFRYFLALFLLRNFPLVYSRTQKWTPTINPRVQNRQALDGTTFLPSITIKAIVVEVFQGKVTTVSIRRHIIIHPLPTKPHIRVSATSHRSNNLRRYTISLRLTLNNRNIRPQLRNLLDTLCIQTLIDKLQLTQLLGHTRVTQRLQQVLSLDLAARPLVAGDAYTADVGTAGDDGGEGGVVEGTGLVEHGVFERALARRVTEVLLMG